MQHENIQMPEKKKSQTDDTIVQPLRYILPQTAVSSHIDFSLWKAANNMKEEYEGIIGESFDQKLKGLFTNIARDKSNEEIILAARLFSYGFEVFYNRDYTLDSARLFKAQVYNDFKISPMPVKTPYVLEVAKPNAEKAKIFIDEIIRRILRNEKDEGLKLSAGDISSELRYVDAGEKTWRIIETALAKEISRRMWSSDPDDIITCLENKWVQNLRNKGFRIEDIMKKVWKIQIEYYASDIAHRMSLPVESDKYLSTIKFYESEIYPLKLKAAVWKKQTENTILPKCGEKIHKLRDKFADQAVRNMDSSNVQYLPPNVEITFTVPNSSKLPHPRLEAGVAKSGKFFLVQGDESCKRIEVNIKINDVEKEISDLNPDDHKRILENSYIIGLMEKLAKENTFCDFKDVLENNDYTSVREAAVETLNKPPIFSKICENGAKLNATKLNLLQEHRSGFLSFINSIFVGIEKQIDALVNRVKKVFGAPVLMPAFFPNIIETNSEKLLNEVAAVTPPSPTMR